MAGDRFPKIVQHLANGLSGELLHALPKLESGEHIPTIPVLKRILAVLDDELLIGIERRGDNAEPEREIAPVPDLVDA